METLKKFVKYYAPYKGVFFLDLLCAAIISFVDLAFPQILRSLTKTLFLKDAAVILQALLPIGAGLLLMYAIQALCKYYVTCQGHMMGARMSGICARNCLSIMKNCRSLIIISIIPVR